MILTVTLNPVLDKSVTVDKIVPDQKLRCSNPTYYAGGGGINVSKGIKKLDGHSIALFPSGGANGKKIEWILSETGIPTKVVNVDYETRESFIVNTELTNQQYRFNTPGEEISSQILDTIFEYIVTIKPKILVVSGSLPIGAPLDTYATIAKIAHSINSKMILDTSGDALKHAAESGVFLLKPNINELSNLVGESTLELDLVDEAAQSIIEKGYCEVVVVSMGASGALLVTKDTYQHIKAPPVKKVSTVGAGDSMVAGLAYALSNEKSLLEMVQLGVACGTAATMNPGASLFKQKDVQSLMQYILRKN